MNNLKVYENNTIEIVGQVVDQNDLSVNIEDSTIYFIVKNLNDNTLNDDDALIKVTTLPSGLDAQNGIYRLVVQIADNILTGSTIYKYDINIKDKNDSIFTLSTGQVNCFKIVQKDF